MAPSRHGLPFGLIPIHSRALPGNSPFQAPRRRPTFPIGELLTTSDNHCDSPEFGMGIFHG
jgi:hypothetical protein